MAENKNLEEFMAKLAKDEKLLQELQEAAKNDPIKGAYNFALEHSNGGFTEDEFGECLKEILDACAAKIKQMDESELENVAGGELSEEDRKQIANMLRQQSGSNAKTEEVKGKWSAITAGINSLGSAANIFQTIANMWATWMARKDQKALRKVQGAEAALKIEKYKAMLREQYGYNDDQINEILEQF